MKLPATLAALGGVAMGVGEAVSFVNNDYLFATSGFELMHPSLYQSNAEYAFYGGVTLLMAGGAVSMYRSARNAVRRHLG